MSTAFEQIPADAFKSLPFGAGMLMSEFDTTNPLTSAAKRDKVICATTGGFTVDVQYDDEDLGADIDNCPEGTMELMQRRNTRMSLGFTCLNITPAALAMAFGATDLNGKKISLREDLKTADFVKRYFVIGLLGGGFAVIEMDNSIATGGASLKTTKNNKGQLSVTLTPKRSMSDPHKVPFTFYVSTDEAT